MLHSLWRAAAMLVFACTPQRRHNSVFSFQKEHAFESNASVQRLTKKELCLLVSYSR